MDIEKLIEERKYLQKLVDEACSRMSMYPDGFITGPKCNKKTTQYYITIGNNRKYLSKRKNSDLVKLYVNKKQDLMILRRVPDQIKAIDKFISLYNPSSLEEICSKCERFGEFYMPTIEPFQEKEVCKSVSDASTEIVKTADDTDLARNLIAICSAFLQSKGC